MLLNQMVKQKNEVGSMRKYIEASSTLNDCETDTKISGNNSNQTDH